MIVSTMIMGTASMIERSVFLDRKKKQKNLLYVIADIMKLGMISTVTKNMLCSVISTDNRTYTLVM